MNLTFVTGNADKLTEVCQILGDIITIDSVSLDISEIQGSIKEVATAKAKEAYKSLKKPVLTEDTSLCFEAFGNELPGPYIKYFLSSMGHEGLCKMVSRLSTQTAEAICTFAYCWSDSEEPMIFQGKCKGSIAGHPRSASSFGWDSIFVPLGFNESFAEMSKEKKNSISHRRRALDRLVAYFKQNQ